MATKRITEEIRCIDCSAANAYERCNQGVWEIFCPDCGAVFGADNLPKECRNCKAHLRQFKDRGKGLCVSCVVASWTPEKRDAIKNIIGMAFRKPEPSDAEKDTAIDEAFKHVK